MDNITSFNWQAWINQQPVQPTLNGTLHVIGEVDSHSTKFAFLKKTVPQGINESILLLELHLHSGIVPAKNPQSVHYNEELKHTYSSIEIFYNSQEIAEITDIPVVK